MTWASTPETPIAAPGRPAPAPLALRLAAYVLDLVFASMVFFTMPLLGGAVAGLLGTTEQTDDELLFPASMVLGVALVCVLPAVVTALPDASNGATLGKRILGLRAIRLDDRRIGFGRALVRESLFKLVLPLTVLWLLADAIVAATRPDRRALHDLVCATTVRRTR